MTYEYDRPKRECIVSYVIGIIAANKQNKTGYSSFDEINDKLERYGEPKITEQEVEIINLIQLMEQCQYMGIGGRNEERATRRVYHKLK